MNDEHSLPPSPARTVHDTTFECVLQLVSSHWHRSEELLRSEGWASTVYPHVVQEALQDIVVCAPTNHRMLERTSTHGGNHLFFSHSDWLPVSGRLHVMNPRRYAV